MNSGMISPAASTKKAVIAPSAISMIQNSVEARPEGFAAPFCSRSVNTGTNAADSADCANRLATRFGTSEAIVYAEAVPLVPKYFAKTISRSSPGDPRDAGAEREDRRVAGHAASARRSWRGRFLRGSFSSGRQGRYSTALRGAPGQLDSGLAAVSMANIHSQKKRILRTERERLENRQYTSAIKTHFRSLESLVQAATTQPPTPRTASSSARSTRPSSAARCTATTARTRSLARPAC